MREQDEQILDVMDSLKRCLSAKISLKTSQLNFKKLRSYLSEIGNQDDTLTRQYMRTHFICYSFIKALESDLISKDIETQTKDGGVAAILLNSLDYIRRNVRTLLEICSALLQDVISYKSISEL